jgi:serine---pyruvate transaminase
VRVVLNDIKEEGLENVFKRHNRLARSTRAAVQAFGLSMIAPDNPADSTTGVFAPNVVDGGKLAKNLRDDFGVTLTDGQDQWKGKVVRIAHLGYMDTFDIIIVNSALEMALKKFDAQVQHGKAWPPLRQYY